MYSYDQRQNRITKSLFSMIIALSLIFGLLFESTAIKAEAAQKKATLEGIKVSLKKGTWVRSITSEKGTTWYIVKGKKSRIFVTPTFSRPLSKYRISNQYKCNKKGRKIIKLSKSGKFKANKTGTVNITITTKVKKSKTTYYQKKKSKLRIVVVSKAAFINYFRNRESASKNTSQETTKKTETTTLKQTSASDNLGTVSMVVPGYWKTHLNNKVSTLKNLDAKIGNHGFSFVFITDLHWRDNNKTSPTLIKYITEHTSVKTVIGGGDILNAEPTVNSALNVLNSWENAVKGLGMINLYGNHDNNSNKSKSQSIWLGYNRWYNIMMKPIEKRVTQWSADKKDFFIDNKSQKVRMIFLNTGFDNGAYLKSSQTDWLEKGLQNTEKGWKVILFQHICFNFTTKKANVQLSLHNSGLLTKKAIDNQYSKMKQNGVDFVGVISGHIHRDYAFTTDKGYPFITTTCDASGNQAANYDYPNSVRKKGTTTEQAFDVYHVDTDARKIYVTRIGAGSDRQLSY